MAVDGRAGGRVQGGLHALRQGQILSELILQGQILSGLILLINKEFKTSFKRLQLYVRFYEDSFHLLIKT
jgi:hypothetical protein